MDANTTSVVKDLFRQFPRLMRKLSSEETRAINELVNKRVRKDYASLLHDITWLEVSRDKAEQKLREALESARKEAEKDKSLVREYRRGFGSVSQLLSNKELRFEGKLEQAEKLMREAEEHLKQADDEKKALQTACQEKDTEIKKLRTDMARLKEKEIQEIKQAADYKDLLAKNEKMRKDILRLKFDLDIQKRENNRLLKDIARLKSGFQVGACFPDDETDAGLKWAGRVQLSPAHTAVTDPRGMRRSRSSSLLRQRDATWMPRSHSTTNRDGDAPSTTAALFAKRDQSISALGKLDNYKTKEPTKTPQFGEANFALDRLKLRYPLTVTSPKQTATPGDLLKKRQATPEKPRVPHLLTQAASAPPLPPQELQRRCGPDCRSKLDLEECRAHLARTCQQNAYLSYTLASLRDNTPTATARDGDARSLAGRGLGEAAAINLNVQLKQLGLGDLYTYRQRVSLHPAPPPAQYTQPPPAGGLELHKVQDYNTSRRVRHLTRPKLVYRK